MTDDRDREEQPRVRITDRRRFANLSDEVVPAGAAGTTSAAPEDENPEDEAAEVAGDLAAAQGEAEQYLDHLRRLQAEFDNYRKRVVKEQTELAELGAMPVARRLLEVLDDFELALMSATDQPDFDRFLKGVELVYAKLLDALKAAGIVQGAQLRIAVSLLGFRNDALHADWAKVERAGVHAALEFVQQLLLAHFA